MARSSSNNFLPNSYNLKLKSNESDTEIHGQLTIKGMKAPPPSKRITLHQTGLKILSARITGKNKKGEFEAKVLRINHIKSFEEVRIHTEEPLYPGPYTITIEYSCRTGMEKLRFLAQQGAWEKMSWRDVFPCIDSAVARETATVEITQEQS